MEEWNGGICDEKGGRRWTAGSGVHGSRIQSSGFDVQRSVSLGLIPVVAQCCWVASRVLRKLITGRFAQDAKDAKKGIFLQFYV